jgi:hypothetical protein
MTNSTKAPTAAQIRLNHERATTAVARLNEKAYNGTRYELVADRLDQPAVIVKYVRPYGFENRHKPERETFRYTTRIEQTIGWPVSYTNKYSASNIGTMCYGFDAAETRRRNELEGVQAMERKVEKPREELAAAEAHLASRKAELGL